MKSRPLVDYRVYLTLDYSKGRVVNTKHYDLRPDRGAGKEGDGTTEKEIVIHVQKKDMGSRRTNK